MTRTPSQRAREAAAKVAEMIVGDRAGVPERIRIATAIRAMIGDPQ